MPFLPLIVSFFFSYLIGQQGILPSPWIMGVGVWGVLPAASLSVVDLAHSRPGPSWDKREQTCCILRSQDLAKSVTKHNSGQERCSPRKSVQLDFPGSQQWPFWVCFTCLVKELSICVPTAKKLRWCFIWKTFLSTQHAVSGDPGCERDRTDLGQHNRRGSCALEGAFPN